VLGLPTLLAGSVLCCLGLALGSRRVGSSHYRPDPWKAPEWIVVACGVVPAAVLTVGLGISHASLNPSLQPLGWPSLPVVPALAILVAALAAVAAPPPVRSARTPRDAEPGLFDDRDLARRAHHADPPVRVTVT
jgi:energy-coupling factor transport system permease protein